MPYRLSRSTAPGSNVELSISTGVPCHVSRAPMRCFELDRPARYRRRYFYWSRKVLCVHGFQSEFRVHRHHCYWCPGDANATSALRFSGRLDWTYHTVQLHCYAHGTPHHGFHCLRKAAWENFKRLHATVPHSILLFFTCLFFYQKRIFVDITSLINRIAISAVD